jgi:hypothetical protein
MEALLTFSCVAFCSKTVCRVPCCRGAEYARKKAKNSEFVLYTRRINSFKEAHTLASPLHCSARRKIYWERPTLFCLPSYLSHPQPPSQLLSQPAAGLAIIQLEDIRGRIQRKTWCMVPYAGVDYNLTLCLPHSRLQHIYHVQPYVNFIPQSRTFDLASE